MPSSKPWHATSATELQREFKGARFLIASGHFDYFGGAERQAVLLAECLVKEYACHVDFLGWGGDGVLADEIRAVGCHPFVFPLDTRQRGLGFLHRLYQLSRYIRNDIRPQYLLPFVGMHCKIIGAIWRRTGAKFTWWNQRDEGRMVYGTRREHYLMRSLPAIVSNSWEGRDFLIKKFDLPEHRVRVINNGIVIPETQSQTSWGTVADIGPNEIVFTMVANLSGFKDHRTLLHAFALLRKTEIGSRCRLVLAGRFDEMTQELKALAFDLGLWGGVHFPGSLRVHEVSSLLSRTDVVVHSSVKEGCPNGALEAMAHGLCVLGTDISGMRQALGNEVAVHCLAPPGDSNRLAELMFAMASSPEKRDEFGRKNLSRIRSDFSVQQMTRAVLETVLEHRIA